MAAIPTAPLVARDAIFRRKNWAAREPGVVTVFCIVGVVAIGLTYLYIHKWITRRRIAKAEAAAKA